MEKDTLAMFTKTVQYFHDLIWISPVCDFFELNVQYAHRKLKKDPILQNLWTKKSTDLGQVDKNGRILLSKKGFLRWVSTINVTSIKESLRDKFIEYQNMLFDFLIGNQVGDEEGRINYLRLKKMRRLYGKLGAEIQKAESINKRYMDGHFGQLQLFN